jgi:hypothetical protein
VKSKSALGSDTVLMLTKGVISDFNSFNFSFISLNDGRMKEEEVLFIFSTPNKENVNFPNRHLSLADSVLDSLLNC